MDLQQLVYEMGKPPLKQQTAYEYLQAAIDETVRRAKESDNVEVVNELSGVIDFLIGLQVKIIDNDINEAKETIEKIRSDASPDTMDVAHIERKLIVNAETTRLTIKVPDGPSFADVKVQVEWTTEDREPCIRKVTFLKWRDRVETENFNTDQKIDDMVMDALVDHLKEKGRGNECATHEDASFPRRY